MSTTKWDFAIELCGRLKQLKRKGWVMNNVENPECVADHSMRTAFLALILCPPEVDKDKAVEMALVHDVAESIITDITPRDGVPREEKLRRENDAWSEISESLGSREMQALWQELEAGETPEARFVNQLDKLEMLIQAEEYENAQNLNLSQFFDGLGLDFFTTDSVRAVYLAIMERRANRQTQPPPSN